MKRPGPRNAARNRFLVLLLIASVGGCRGGNRPAREAREPDIVLVTIDTLRADAVGFSGKSRVSTPNLDRLAAEGRVFTNAHAHNVVTLPSHVNILTGLYPFEHGVRDNDGYRLDPKFQTAADFLKSRGYSTAAFIGAFPLDSRFGLSRGFEVYDEHYPEGAGPDEFIMAERPGSEVIDGARRWLRSRTGAPFFLWVHLYDCHAPYRPPPPFDRQYADSPYLGEVAAVDSAIGPLLDDLRGRPSPTFLVLTSDHGEALGDHGERTHGLFAYEATLHIPLVVWGRGLVKPGVDSALARHVDILPTILEEARIPLPAGLPGVSLLSGRRDAAETSYFESLTASLNRGWAPLRGEMGRGFKYVDLPIPELYDLGTDPGEQRNRVSDNREMVRLLKGAIPPRAFEAATPSVSTEERARLQNLGYLSGRAAARENYGPGDDPKNLVELDSKLHRLIDLYQAGKVREAASLAREVIGERPAMVTGYEFLAFLQAQAGEPAAAIRTYRQADAKKLLDPVLLSRWGLLCSESGQNAEALRILEPLSSSEDPDILNAIGIARATAGETQKAIAIFHRVLEVDPRNASAWQNIGITELQKDRVPEALESLGKALSTNDRLPRAWNARGVALLRAGQPREAVAAWNRTVELDPKEFDALYNIAVTARQLGDVSAARQALKRFVAEAPPSRYGRDIPGARRMLRELGGKS